MTSGAREDTHLGGANSSSSSTASWSNFDEVAVESLLESYSDRLMAKVEEKMDKKLAEAKGGGE